MFSAFVTRSHEVACSVSLLMVAFDLPPLPLVQNALSLSPLCLRKTRRGCTQALHAKTLTSIALGHVRSVCLSLSPVNRNSALSHLCSDSRTSTHSQFHIHAHSRTHTYRHTRIHTCTLPLPLSRSLPLSLLPSHTLLNSLIPLLYCVRFMCSSCPFPYTSGWCCHDRCWIAAPPTLTGEGPWWCGGGHTPLRPESVGPPPFPPCLPLHLFPGTAGIPKWKRGEL